MINPISVFTKPWKCSLAELGEKMAALGVDGIELPIRPGYQVEPENVQEQLPAAAAELQKYGIKIYSVAGPVDEATIAACGSAGVPILRTMIRIDKKKGYMQSVADERAVYQKLLPALEKHQVTIGVQNHCDYWVGSAIGLVHAIGDFSPKQVGAVLDPAHCGLDGEPDAMAIDIAWPHLVMVNLKNAFRVRLNGPEATEARWRHWWTTGRHGFSSWQTIADTLKQRNYQGVLCLTAEYSNPAGGDLTEDDVMPLLKEDIAYVRTVFA